MRHQKNILVGQKSTSPAKTLFCLLQTVVQYPFLPQQPQLGQQCGVLLCLLGGGLGSLLMLQTETLDLLQDLPREDR